MKILGFSLIELMVVIAIIGILAAIAVPNYSSYTKRSKIASTIPTARSFGDKLILYYDRTGKIPTSASQLGFPSETNNFPTAIPPNSVSDYAAPPYVLGFAFGGAPSSAGQCAQLEVVTYISNYDSTGALTASNDADYMYFYNYYISSNGAWNNVCVVYDFTDTTSYMSPISQGCYNGVSVTSFGDAGVKIAELRASCQ